MQAVIIAKEVLLQAGKAGCMNIGVTLYLFSCKALDCLPYLDSFRKSIPYRLRILGYTLVVHGWC